MLLKSSLTILFENPFWIGLYERVYDNEYEVCKITFGAEPKDYEVYDFLLKNWHKLKFSPPVKTERIEEHKINPKRMQREINSQLENKGIGTKAQQWCYVKITDTLNLCFLVKSAKFTNWSHLFHGLLDNEPLMA